MLLVCLLFAKNKSQIFIKRVGIQFNVNDSKVLNISWHQFQNKLQIKI